MNLGNLYFKARKSGQRMENSSTLFQREGFGLDSTYVVSLPATTSSPSDYPEFRENSSTIRFDHEPFSSGFSSMGSRVDRGEHVSITYVFSQAANRATTKPTSFSHKQQPLAAYGSYH